MSPFFPITFKKLSYENMKDIKKFYENHINFSGRSIIEYYISPGIKCKFDLIKRVLGQQKFSHGLDLGCSGNSILSFLKEIKNKFYYDIALRPLLQHKLLDQGDSICGDLISLPFRNNSFDFISALDVLEHIKNDNYAISEISRVIKKNGIVVVTVPHRKELYTRQDKIIGHFRRYEINELIEQFSSYNLKNISVFGIYGQIMKISDIQAKDPKGVEENITNLRKRYIKSPFFRSIWDIIVQTGAWLMKFEALHQKYEKTMNMAFIFKKEE